MEKRILVFGTFDGIHRGHEFFLRSAKSRGTELVVAVARDAHITELKKRKPRIHEGRRLETVKALPGVVQARLCDEEFGTFHTVEEIAPDLIVLGYDQQALEKALLSWMESSGHYVPMIRIKKL
jgi:FAD synthetase